jgi:hypothetical protein
MNGVLDLKSANFLGGTNVQNLIIIAAVGYLVYKAWK